MKFKFSLPLFAFLVVVVCSLGSVSAANDIHDVTIEDTNTFIEHPEANIHDSTIQNALINTNYVDIRQGIDGVFPSTIRDSKIINTVISTTGSELSTGFLQGSVGGKVQNSELNTAVMCSYGPLIFYQGALDGTVQDSMLNNMVIGSFNQPWSAISQGDMNGIVQNSMLNNAIVFSSGNLNIGQGSLGSKVQNSMLNNAVMGSTNTEIFQSQPTEYGIVPSITIIGSDLSNNVIRSANTVIHQSFGVNHQDGTINDSEIANTVLFSENANISQTNIFNSQIYNATLFSDNTAVNETNLSGVSGCLIAIGCNNYTKTIDNLVDTNFFNLVIGNHEIINWDW